LTCASEGLQQDEDASRRLPGPAQLHIPGRVGRQSQRQLPVETGIAELSPRTNDSAQTPVRTGGQDPLASRQGGTVRGRYLTLIKVPPVWNRGRATRHVRQQRLRGHLGIDALISVVRGLQRHRRMCAHVEGRPSQLQPSYDRAAGARTTPGQGGVIRRVPHKDFRVRLNSISLDESEGRVSGSCPWRQG